MLFRTMGRIFSGLSDTAKAFIIIAVTDILLGYHSEEGWTAAIRMLTSHYGYETEVGPPHIHRACSATHCTITWSSEHGNEARSGLVVLQ